VAADGFARVYWPAWTSRTQSAKHDNETPIRRRNRAGLFCRRRCHAFGALVAVRVILPIACWRASHPERTHRPRGDARARDADRALETFVESIFLTVSGIGLTRLREWAPNALSRAHDRFASGFRDHAWTFGLVSKRSCSSRAASTCAVRVGSWFLTRPAVEHLPAESG